MVHSDTWESLKTHSNVSTKDLPYKILLQLVQLLYAFCLSFVLGLVCLHLPDEELHGNFFQRKMQKLSECLIFLLKYLHQHLQQHLCLDKHGGSQSLWKVTRQHLPKLEKKRIFMALKTTLHLRPHIVTQTCLNPNLYFNTTIRKNFRTRNVLRNYNSVIITMKIKCRICSKKKPHQNHEQ